MGVNVCVYVGEGLRRSFATPNPVVLTNKICLNQAYKSPLFSVTRRASVDQRENLLLNISSHNE